jgi:hypothetical protein
MEPHQRQPGQHIETREVDIPIGGEGDPLG